MHDPLPRPTPSTGDEAVTFSQTARTVVSFLLFIHFFALTIGIASSWSPSPLTAAIRKVPSVGPYLEYFWFDVSYFPLHRLTQGDRDDTDAVVEIKLTAGNGSTHEAEFPRREIWPHQRYRRYARLAEHVAGLSQDDSLSSLLAEDIAIHFADTLVEGQVKRGELSCRRHLMLNMNEVSSSSATERDPFDGRLYFDVYRANLLSFRGRIQLRKVESRGENAPAAAGGARGEPGDARGDQRRGPAGPQRKPDGRKE